MTGPSIELKDLKFNYEGGEPVFKGISLTLPKGARTLLLGANGVGKSTLLQLLAGLHMLAEPMIRVFGSAPFFDMSLSHRVALVDGDFPIYVDLTVRELLAHPSPGVDPSIEKELLELLEISPTWRMCRVSEGQRRRVQLLMALRKPVELLLLDEVTSHLDIVVRADLLTWLKKRNETSNLSILYTTHILDGLWSKAETPWPTHVAFLKYQTPILVKAMSEMTELKKRADEGSLSPLLGLAEDWIRGRLTDFR